MDMDHKLRPLQSTVVVIRFGVPDWNVPQVHFPCAAVNKTKPIQPISKPKNINVGSGIGVWHAWCHCVVYESVFACSRVRLYLRMQGKASKSSRVL